MKPYMNDLNKARIRGLSLAVLMTLGLPLLAFAALGGSLDSVQADQAHFKATTIITNGGAYTVHELKTPSDIIVREYVSTGGLVFGVSWRGPFIPDMQQLLGGYFPQYVVAAKAERERHLGRVPLNIHLPGLVVQTSGHMRSYFGRAYDPQLLPAGAGPDDVR